MDGSCRKKLLFFIFALILTESCIVWGAEAVVHMSNPGHGHGEELGPVPVGGKLVEQQPVSVPVPVHVPIPIPILTTQTNTTLNPEMDVKPVEVLLPGRAPVPAPVPTPVQVPVAEEADLDLDRKPELEEKPEAEKILGLLQDPLPLPPILPEPKPKPKPNKTLDLSPLLEFPETHHPLVATHPELWAAADSLLDPLLQVLLTLDEGDKRVYRTAEGKRVRLVELEEEEKGSIEGEEVKEEVPREKCFALFGWGSKKEEELPAAPPLPLPLPGPGPGPGPQGPGSQGPGSQGPGSQGPGPPQPFRVSSGSSYQVDPNPHENVGVPVPPPPPPPPSQGYYAPAPGQFQPPPPNTQYYNQYQGPIQGQVPDQSGYLVPAPVVSSYRPSSEYPASPGSYPPRQVSMKRASYLSPGPGRTIIRRIRPRINFKPIFQEISPTGSIPMVGKPKMTHEAPGLPLVSELTNGNNPKTSEAIQAKASVPVPVPVAVAVAELKPKGESGLNLKQNSTVHFEKEIYSPNPSARTKTLPAVAVAGLGVPVPVPVGVPGSVPVFVPRERLSGTGTGTGPALKKDDKGRFFFSSYNDHYDYDHYDYDHYDYHGYPHHNYHQQSYWYSPYYYFRSLLGHGNRKSSN